MSPRRCRLGLAIITGASFFWATPFVWAQQSVPQETIVQEPVEQDPEPQDPAPQELVSPETAPQEPAAQATDRLPVAPGTLQPGFTDDPEPRPVPSRFGARPPDSAFGAFQRGLFLTARNLALPRAQAGDAAAQTLLGEIYSRGLGVALDEQEAEKWYAMAAEQGVAEAQLQVALAELEREAGSERGRQLMKAAAEAGHSRAMFNHAQLLLTDRPGPGGQMQAFEFFLRAAQAGIADAQYAIAQYYLQATPPAFYDPAAGRQWLQRAARLGFDSAQFELGLMMLEGVGGPRDFDSAFLWTLAAARTGNVAAQAQLAKLLWNGLGVEPDDTEAAAWYVLARRTGYRDAVLEDFWAGLSPQTRQTAIARANRL